MAGEHTVMPAETRRRLLAFEGACNFRDLGGYVCTDGGRVRFGRLFRSGALSHLGASAAPHLAALGVRAIWDLRRARERQHAPTGWPGSDVEHRYVDDPADEAALQLWRRGAAPTAAAMRAAMLELYGAMPQWLGARLRGLFATLAAGTAPLIFHCSAGKDRTGVAAALVLSALGVPRDTVYEDYLMTNTAVDLERHFLRQSGNALGLGDSWDFIAGLTAGARRALLVADVEYLDAAFQAIERQHGSVERFLEEALGVAAGERRRLRELLVED